MNLKSWFFFKLTSIAKALPQPAKGQAKSCFPSWKTRMWLWRLNFVVKLFSQPSLTHLNMRRSPEWTNSLCFCKNQALWNIFSHCSHGRVTVKINIYIWLSTGTLQLAFKFWKWLSTYLGVQSFCASDTPTKFFLWSYNAPFHMGNLKFRRESYAS